MSEIFKRSHMCGTLTSDNVGEEVVLNGWVAKQRRLGGLIFTRIRQKMSLIWHILSVENLSLG